MKSNKIEGIKPFNKFFFRSCYYHQLIAGLASFGISYEDILMGSFVFSEKNFKTNKCYATEYELEKNLGYKNIRCNMTKNRLIQCIDKKRPVIVGVDCFYYESRPDTFNKLHEPHHVLVYGYDLEKEIFNVVDPNYRNSYVYVEKTVPMESLLYANKLFRYGFFKRKKTCHLLVKNGAERGGGISFLKQFETEKFEESKEASCTNLNELKLLIGKDEDALKNMQVQISTYLQDIKSFFSNISFIEKFTDTQEKKLCVSELVNGYANLISIFWRMNDKNDFGFAKRNFQHIARKIDGLIEKEAYVYKIIEEGVKCLLKK